jgi:hypothetical protein
MIPVVLLSCADLRTRTLLRCGAQGHTQRLQVITQCRVVRLFLTVQSVGSARQPKLSTTCCWSDDSPSEGELHLLQTLPRENLYREYMKNLWRTLINEANQINLCALRSCAADLLSALAEITRFSKEESFTPLVCVQRPGACVPDTWCPCCSNPQTCRPGAGSGQGGSAVQTEPVG